MSTNVSGEAVVDIRVNVEPAVVDVESLQKQFVQLEQIILRSLVLTRRMGLPDDVSRAISGIQRMIVLTNQLRIAMLALQAASGPVGWALAGLGLAVTAFSYADAITYESRG
jgi:hypothetical protein